MDLAHIVYWEVDPATDTHVFNDPFYALYGTTAEREGGYRMSTDDYVTRFMHPDDISRFYQMIEQSDARPGPEFLSEFEHRIVRRDGEVRHILARIRVVKDDSGNLVKVYGANQDITERVQARESRRTSELQLAEAIDMARLAYWEADGTKDVFTFNDAFYNLIGTTAEREGGYTIGAEQYFRKFVHPDDLATVYRFLEGLRTNVDVRSTP